MQRTPVDDAATQLEDATSAHATSAHATIAAAETHAGPDAAAQSEQSRASASQPTFVHTQAQPPSLQTHRVPDAVVQRAMAAYVPPPTISAVPATNVAVVQRSFDGDGGEGQAAQVDLDALARDVYPILRRMLEVDRERRTRF